MPGFEARGTEFCHTEAVYGTTINEKGVDVKESREGLTGQHLEGVKGTGYEVIYYDFKE